MSTKKCVLCGKDIEGSLYEIRLTLCCKECCENVEDPDEKKICSDIRAMREFGCRRFDLKRLDCLREINPHDRRPAWLQFYLIAEVKHLGELVESFKEEKRNSLRQIDEGRCVVKRQRLETRHRVMVEEIRPILRPFVLGDYLQSFRSKTLLRDVKQRYSVRDPAAELVDSCNAHPISALAFCMGHPKGTAETYKDLRENMKKVFLIEGNRIMQMLTPGDKERLKGTPLEDVLAQFENRDTKTILFRKLEERVGAATAEEIIHHPACQQRINRGGEETQVAEKLVAFWSSKDNKEQRHLELKNALIARQVRLDMVASICKEYITATIDVDLDEVVGIAEINAILWHIGPMFWSNYHDSCEKEFRRCLIDEQLSFKKSLKMAMSKIAAKRGMRYFLPRFLFEKASDED